MAARGMQLSLRWRLVFVAVLASAASAVAVARAEIILDGFDEPFEIILPEMELEYIFQPGVGALNAERRSHAGGISADPIGTVDADVSNESSLSFAIDRLQLESGISLTSVFLGLDYYFDEIDVTQAGVNDRVSIDFAFLRSAVPLGRVDVFLQDASQPGISYVSQLFDIPTRDEPFTLEFPFDSFGVRAGGSGETDFQRVRTAIISVFPVRSLSYSGPDEIEFSTSIDQIRFSNKVPEPNTFLLACLVGSFYFVSYRRRVMRCGTSRLLPYRLVCYSPCWLSMAARSRN